MRTRARTLGAALGALFLGRAVLADPGGAKPPPAAPSLRTLHVTGEGRAMANPDVAVVTLGITALDGSLARATRDANERAKRALDVLRPAVVPADMKTVRYAVEVEYARQDRPDAEPRITGYRVENAIEVKIRDLSKVGSLLDAAVSAGANEVEGLTFGKDDPAAEEALARSEAVRAARTKAEEMAKAAGVELGELIELSEGPRVMPLRPLAPRAMAMAGSPAPPVEAGALEITTQVEAVYAIR